MLIIIFAMSQRSKKTYTDINQGLSPFYFNRQKQLCKKKLVPVPPTYFDSISSTHQQLTWLSTSPKMGGSWATRVTSPSISQRRRGLTLTVTPPVTSRGMGSALSSSSQSPDGKTAGWGVSRVGGGILKWMQNEGKWQSLWFVDKAVGYHRAVEAYHEKPMLVLQLFNVLFTSLTINLMPAQ